MSSADEIRAKRLAKLAGSSRPNTPQQSQQPQPQPQPQSQSQSQSQSATTRETNSTPSNRNTPTPASTTNTDGVSEKSAAIATHNNIASPPASIKPTQSKEDHLAQWLSSELKHIFKVTLDSSQNSTNLVFLPNLAHELQNSNDKLNENYLDSIFMETLSETGVPGKRPIAYLYSVYHAAYKVRRSLPIKTVFHDEKVALLSQIVNLSVRYGNMGLQIPDMFLSSNVEQALNTLVDRFADMSSFLVDIVKVSYEEDTLLELLNLILPFMSSRLKGITFKDQRYLNYLSVIETLVSVKPVAAIFSQIAGFQPPSKESGLDFELKSLLGPILRVSPLIDTAGPYFGEEVSKMSPIQIHSAYESLQNEYKVALDRLFVIVDKLIRGSTETRTDVIQWLAELVNKSHLRRGSHVDFQTVASDGLMFNITVILIKLSMPFLDYPAYGKIDKIDVEYFTKSSLLDIKEESRVNSTIEEATTYGQSRREELGTDVTNFISDCFNLTLAYLHYGVGGIFIKFDRMKRTIDQAESQIAAIEAGRAGVAPGMQERMRAQLPIMHSRVNALKSSQHAINAVFSYRDLQLEIFDFVIGATVFITRLIDPNHSYPQKKLKIPIFKISKVSDLDDHDFLKTKTPIPWKYYPEFLLEGIINYTKFSANFRGCPLVLNEDKLNLFVEFVTILLRCPELIGNPHMKANIVEILYIGSLPRQDGHPGFMVSIFDRNELVTHNLLYSLLDFYVMVEKTGASSQFYDKFNSRYYISVILEELWKIPQYRLQLKDYSENNVDFFIRFIARMLNDTTYLLDETFNLLNSIHDYQVEVKRRQTGNEPNEEMGNDETLNSNLEGDERRVKSLIALSNETMELFKLFTKEVPQGFVLPEIVDRLAGMLDYNLSVLVGPKCSNLKVAEPEKYKFEPKKILSDICEVYVNLSLQKGFVIAVSRDGRSFNVAYFKKAEDILTKRTFVDNRIINSLAIFAAKAEENRLVEESEELELGDVPDEFLDPLMFTVMEDPVVLPSSKISIDRSTIKAHLLSDATDPFNRVPLKLEDVQDDVELKAKISAFKLQKKQEKQHEQGDDVVMSD
ncbi:ufd2 [Candida theae]|uniref:RING-type E3 ubiquitin transferase n=1 Tax=Candida theae TaxID=1198502 RepID=A0AAD5FW98_9ASCO|nr:ufd2 [Candida theae]KAI5948688.1 ufd2 [Candida theae]